MPRDAHQHEELVLWRAVKEAPIASSAIEETLVPMDIAQLRRDKHVVRTELHAPRDHQALRHRIADVRVCVGIKRKTARTYILNSPRGNIAAVHNARRIPNAREWMQPRDA